MAPSPRPVVRRSLALGAAAAGAALSLRALVRPLPAGDRRLLDWDMVRRVAHGRTGERGAADPAVAAAQGRRYDEVARELAPLMAEVCGERVDSFPPFTVVDRRGFVDRNLVIVQRLFEPVERLRAQVPESRVTAAGRGALSRYVGELFGFLSSRVLGQYDPVLMLAPTPAGGEQAATALYLVEPNVALFERRHHVPGDTLRRWLVLHELTHAWQFEAHPWLREHIGSVMSQLLMSGMLAEAAGQDGRPPSLSLRRLVTGMPAAVRGQLRAVAEVQAVMSVCEGYSNYVMHQVGVRHLDDFERLESAFHRRADERPLLERLVLAVTGMRMKLRQYELGERFAEAVVARGGLTLLNRVWEGPASMPSLAELREPGRWVARMGGR